MEKLHYAIFGHKRALPCITEIILTEKLFGVLRKLKFWIC